MIREIALVVGCSFVSLGVEAVYCQEQVGGFTLAVDATAGEQREQIERNQVEPGVTVYGNPNRFSEVGRVNSFDSAPDGKTLAFAGRQISMFDLTKNKVVAEMGKTDGEFFASVNYSPDGRYILAHAIEGDKIVILVFDAIDLKLLNTIDPDMTVQMARSTPNPFALRVSANSRFVACRTGQSVVRVVSLNEGKQVFESTELGYVSTFEFSSKEHRLLLGCGGRCAMVDLETGALVPADELPFVGNMMDSVVVSYSRQRFAVARQQSGQIMLFNSVSGDRVGIIPAAFSCRKMVFSDDGALLAVAASRATPSSVKSEIVVFDVRHRKKLIGFGVAGNAISRIRFGAKDRTLLFQRHGDPIVNQIDLPDGSLNDASLVDQTPVNGLALTSDRSFLFTCSPSCMTWTKLDTGESLRWPQESDFQLVKFFPDRAELFLATQSPDQLSPIQRVDAKSGKVLKNYSVRRATKRGGVLTQLNSLFRNGRPDFLATHGRAIPFATNVDASGDKIHTLVFSSDLVHQPESGNEYDVLLSSRYICLDAETGKWARSRKLSLEEYGLDIEQPVVGAVSSDGQNAALAQQGHLVVVDLETGDRVFHTALANQIHCENLFFSPRSQFLAGVFEGEVRVWEIDSGKTVKAVESGPDSLVAWSHDGSRIAVSGVGHDRDLVVFETANWERVFKRNKTVAGRHSLALSRDGQMILIGLDDCRVEVWELKAIKSVRK